jgi:hypothetical protein
MISEESIFFIVEWVNNVNLFKNLIKINFLWRLANHKKGGLAIRGRTVQWDATHQGSNTGARTFYWVFQDLPVLCVRW